MTTTTPTPALADLPQYTAPDLSRHAMDDAEKATYKDGHRAGWRAAETELRARRAAQPVAPVQVETPAAFAQRYSELMCENARLKKKLAETQPKCPTCKGNDNNVPCAYPSSGMAGCLRDKRLATPSPQIAEVAELERAEFEIWAKEHGYDLERADGSNYNIPKGSYLSNGTSNDWEVWQAASRRAAGDEVLRKALQLALKELNRCIANPQVVEQVKAALATPAPASAGQAGQVAKCVICGSDEPRTGTCGSNDARALCNRPTERAAAPAEQSAARLEKFIDWYLRAGKRMEIDPHGHIRVTTREHIINWLDGGSNEGSR